LIKVEARLIYLSEHVGERIPYAIVQACMTERHEAKVVCLNMEPRFVATITTQAIGRVFSKHPHVELFAFVRSALKKLKARQPRSLLDGLVRVDVFLSARGFVVNEFESLEACYCSSHTNEMEVVTFLEDYWKLKLDVHVVAA